MSFFWHQRGICLPASKRFDVRRRKSGPGALFTSALPHVAIMSDSEMMARRFMLAVGDT
jgi:hypothetical protein